MKGQKSAFGAQSVNGGIPVHRDNLNEPSLRLTLMIGYHGRSADIR
jgi:hypothetical protein